MKITLPSIFLNLFIITTTISPLTAVIYDSSGNRLLRGIPYHILPLLSGSGGGLTVSRSTRNACPLNITQEPFEANQGVPFTFNPIVTDEALVRGAYPMSIEAGVINPCTGSKILMVTTSDNANQFLKDSNSKKKDEDVEVHVEIVTTGGEFNKPESCFQIVEDDMMPGLQSYQIQNCPFKCGSSSEGYACYNVGVVTDVYGNGYLGRTDEMFPVVFTSSYDATISPLADTNVFSELSAKANRHSFSRSEK